MVVSNTVAHALVEALTKYKDLQPRWISVLGKLLGGHGAIGLLRYQSDYRIDLLLRAMEDERPTLAEPTDEPAITLALLAGAVQGALTRYWIFSAYEALRMAKNLAAGKADPKLRALYERFRIIRIPLAKLQIANDAGLKTGIMLGTIGPGADTPPEEYSAKAKVEYHPVVLLNRETGSIGWMVIDGTTGIQETIFRRELSDQLLALFD